MKKVHLTIIFSFLLLNVCVDKGKAEVSKVHIIFKTFHDFGFTDLHSVSEQHYIQEFFPKAMDVVEELRKSGGEERYVLTTVSWLVQSFLDQASPEQKHRFEDAIRRGDIVWTGLPYSVGSEIMSKNQFRTILQLSKQLDCRFGKKTISAKTNDVPGHTRGIIPLLAQADIRFIHINVNPTCAAPSVPPICRWQDPEGNEIIFMCQKGYRREEVIFPNGETAMVIAFTGDNQNPHSIDQVKEIYASLRKKYPKAQLVASTLSDVALELEKQKDILPVFTGEIGDTWVYGYGSSPVRMACYRELFRLYDQWIISGKLNPESEEAVRFMVRLGLIAEHTWGVSIETYLKNWDKYDFEKFTEARTLPEFQFVELSWKELSDRLYEAIDFLPESLKNEAKEALYPIEHPNHPKIKKGKFPDNILADGSMLLHTKNIRLVAGRLAYQTFSNADYQRFSKNYITHPSPDAGKPGLDKSTAQSAEVESVVIAGGKTKKGVASQLAFQKDKRIDSRVFPEKIFCQYHTIQKTNVTELSITLWKKPANRLPEAYWYSFYPEDVIDILVEKTGQRVNVLDVVEGGNRQLHGVDHYVDVKTDAGTVRIHSMDALLVAIGERNLLNYSTQQPDISQGIHFCLFNNVWETSFSQWFEGSITYRFKIEILA